MPYLFLLKYVKSFFWMGVWCWLPVMLNAQHGQLTQLLRGVHGSMEPFVEQEDSLKNSTLGNKQNGISHAAPNHASWHYKLNYQQVDGAVPAIDVELSISLKAKHKSAAVMGLNFNFSDWSKNNYVLVPAAVYNGNRFKTVNMRWPTVVQAPDRYHDISPIIPDYLPHLSLNEAASNLKLKLNDASCPAIAFFSPTLKRSFLLLIKPTQNFELAINESANATKASLSVYSVQKGNLPVNDSNFSFKIAFRIYAFRSEYPIDLLYTFFKLRKKITGPNTYVNTIPFRKVFELEETLHNTERWNDSMKYYRQGGNHELKQCYSGIQLGWIGGMIEELPLMIAGNAMSKARSMQNIETIMREMQDESGLMYGVFKDGVLYSDDFRNNAKKPLLGMARRNGDALYYLLQNLIVLKNAEKEHDFVQKIEPKALKLANVLVNIWKNYKQFGQLFDVKTGQMVVYGSTSGASVVAGLALASQYFKNIDYLKIAEAAAELYYNRDLKNGYTTGGPGEAIQCPDSESAFALVEGLVALYEITKEKKYLTMATDAVAYFSTWVTSYDYTFPPQSALGLRNVKATGSVWANIQNQHAAPAICNYSGEALLKLYRFTNNTIYLELLKDIVHNSVQYVSTAEQMLSLNMLPGYVCERVNISNWEGERNIGGNLFGSCPWVEVALLQSTAQIPSIYIDIHNGKLTVFDHIDASILRISANEILIRLKNPTIYSTTYSVCLDADKHQPIGWNNDACFQKITLKANEEKTIVLKK